MKGKHILLPLALLMLLLVGAGCKKSNPVVMTWDYLGRHYVADSATASSGGATRVVGYSGVTAVGISGGVELLPGTYTLHGYNTGTQPFLFQIVSGNASVFSQSGTVVITGYDNNGLTGTFTATMTDLTTISGTMTDIPFR